MIAVSIVSHGHGPLVARLIPQLRRCPEVTRIILTLNIPEQLAMEPDDLVTIVRNRAPKGYGANNNAAFRSCREPFFCVLNPDIELIGNPFRELLNCLNENGSALVAPLIASPGGLLEDSVRHFPTLASLVKKAVGLGDGRYPVAQGGPVFSPDWVAGMFMLFNAADYSRIGGFDEKYFLYYEDVDICRRLRQAGSSVVVCPSVTAIHDARRASHRSFRHVRWHLASMLRYLTTF